MNLINSDGDGVCDEPTQDEHNDELFLFYIS